MVGRRYFGHVESKVTVKDLGRNALDWQMNMRVMLSVEPRTRDRDLEATSKEKL